MKKNLSTTASVSVRVPIRDILRRYATTAAALATAAVAACGLGGCSGDGVGIGTAMTEKIRGEGGGGVVGPNNPVVPPGGGGGVTPGPDISYGGQDYTSVVIGGKTWMAQNLNYDTANGKGSWCYDNKPDSCAKYGRLYNWKTAMAGSSSTTANSSNVRGVCPEGWHLPSNAEWTALVDYVGSPAGTKLKSKSGWSGSGNGSDAYGFSALPGGYRYYSDSSFNGAGGYGYWWAATENDAGRAYYRYMRYNGDYVVISYYGKEYGFSVRCVRD